MLVKLTTRELPYPRVVIINEISNKRAFRNTYITASKKVQKTGNLPVILHLLDFNFYAAISFLEYCKNAIVIPITLTIKPINKRTLSILPLVKISAAPA